MVFEVSIFIRTQLDSDEGGANENESRNAAAQAQHESPPLDRRLYGRRHLLPTEDEVVEDYGAFSGTDIPFYPGGGVGSASAGTKATEALLGSGDRFLYGGDSVAGVDPLPIGQIDGDMDIEAEAFAAVMGLDESEVRKNFVEIGESWIASEVQRIASEADMNRVTSRMASMQLVVGIWFIPFCFVLFSGLINYRIRSEKNWKRWPGSTFQLTPILFANQCVASFRPLYSVNSSNDLLIV